MLGESDDSLHPRGATAEPDFDGIEPIANT